MVKRVWFYHVYKHIIDGEVIYIGCGDPNRPYNMVSRSEKWKSLTQNKDVVVEIIAKFVFEDRIKALNLESMMIDDIRPRANLYIPQLPKPMTDECHESFSAANQFRRGLRKASENTGISFRQASLAAGYNQNQLNRFMTGKTGIKLGTLVRLCEDGFNIPFGTVLRLGK